MPYKLINSSSFLSSGTFLPIKSSLFGDKKKGAEEPGEASADSEHSDDGEIERSGERQAADKVCGVGDCADSMACEKRIQTTVIRNHVGECTPFFEGTVCRKIIHREINQQFACRECEETTPVPSGE